jgi:hypothetical protein
MPALDDIATSVAELSKLAERLTRIQTNQIARLKTVITSLWVVVISLVISMVILALLTVRVHSQQNTINRQQALVFSVQRSISTDALCPLYDVILDAYNPVRGPQGLGLTPAQYETRMRILEKGATALGCAHHTRGRD